MAAGNHADCKHSEQLLQPYLENRLDLADTEYLLSHLDECSECMDELEIRFLLTDALKRLEDGETLNIKNELHERLDISRKTVTYLSTLNTASNLLTGVSFLMLLLAFVILCMEYL